MSWDGIRWLGRDAATGTGFGGGWEGARKGRLGRDPVAWRYENRDRKDRTEVVEGCEKTCATPLDVRGGTAGLTVPGNRDQKTE